MAAEDSLYTLLSGNAGVTALVSTRIYPDVLPENCTYPAIVYSTQRTAFLLLDGSSAGNDVAINLQAWAKTRVSAAQVSAAVVTALSGTDFYTTLQDAGYDPETGLFAAPLTLEIFE